MGDLNPANLANPVNQANPVNPASPVNLANLVQKKKQPQLPLSEVQKIQYLVNQFQFLKNLKNLVFFPLKKDKAKGKEKAKERAKEKEKAKEKAREKVKERARAKDLAPAPVKKKPLWHQDFD